MPPSPGFQRNSPRLRSFGKKEPRFRGEEDAEPYKALVEPVLPVKGLKAKKGSVKLGSGPGLQYVEVAVDKGPLSPPQASTAGNKINSKTQYAEVLLPASNGYVEEVDESDEPPQLPEKENKRPSFSHEVEDIWVRNTSTPPPSLPPKVRAASKGDAPAAVSGSNEPTSRSGRPPAALPQDAHPAGQSNPEGPNPVSQTGHDVTEQPARRVATPELSRKGYEDMNLTSASSGRATPPGEDIWKLQPQNIREHPKQQPLAYENVQLSHRAKPPTDMQSVCISDVDQQGEGVGEDGYVVVNGPSSKTTDSRGYENVTPGATAPVKPKYENISNEVSYVAMTGRMSADSTPSRTSNHAPHEDDEDTGNDTGDILKKLIQK